MTMSTDLLSTAQPADTFPSTVSVDGNLPQTFISPISIPDTLSQKTSSIDTVLSTPLGPIATDISQMYLVSPDITSVGWQYNVGESPINNPIIYTFQNLTINATLQFSFIYADFLQIDAPSNVIVMMPQSEFKITVSLNELNVKNKSIEKIKNFSNMFSWTTIVLNITGPIYLVTAPPKINIF